MCGFIWAYNLHVKSIPILTYYIDLYPQGLHDVLKIMFKNLSGENRVTENEYEVTENSGETLIQEIDWDTKVFPGARIAMSILIRAVTEKPTAVHECPQCHSSNAGAALDRGELKWYAPRQSSEYLPQPIAPSKVSSIFSNHFRFANSRFCNPIFRTLDTEDCTSAAGLVPEPTTAEISPVASQISPSG